MSQNTVGQVRRIVRLLGVALAAVGVMIGVGWWGTRSTTQAFGRVEHSHQVLHELETTLTHAISIQSGARGYSLTGDEQYLGVYDSGMLEVQHSIRRLRQLLADNPPQSGRLRRLASLVDEEVAVMQQRLTARRAGGLSAASAATADGRGKKVVGEIRSLIRVMQQQERERLAEKSGAVVSLAWLTLLAVGTVAVATGGLVFVAMRAVRILPTAPGMARSA